MRSGYLEVNLREDARLRASSEPVGPDWEKVQKASEEEARQTKRGYLLKAQREHTRGSEALRERERVRASVVRQCS